MPRAGHPHVGAERPTVIEADQTVLADGVDTFDEGVGRERHESHPRHLDPNEPFSGQRPVERPRRAVDGVALGHPPTLETECGGMAHYCNGHCVPAVFLGTVPVWTIRSLLPSR